MESERQDQVRETDTEIDKMEGKGVRVPGWGCQASAVPNHTVILWHKMIPFQVTEDLTAGGPFGVHKTS